MRLIAGFGVAAMLVAFVGCGPSKPVAAPSKPNSGPPAPVLSGGPPPVPGPTVEPGPPLPATPPSVAEIPGAKKAEVGLGKRGHFGEGILATPLSVRFRAEEAIVLNNIKHAVDLYKATEGHAPKTHEEFMEKIIKFNSIKLPELPANEEYRYDPETAELMVIPKQKP